MTAMDAFFEECGGREPIRVELYPQGGGVSVTVEFRKPYVLVGRGAGADMGVDNDDTALRQLYLQLVGGRLYAVQLSEEHPTVRGDELWRSGWVGPDDLFGIHQTNLRVLNPRQGPGDGPPDSPLAVGPSGEPLFTLQCGHGTDLMHEVTNYRPLLLIGRSAPSKVRVRHRSLCPTHAAVVSTPKGFWLVDLSYEGGVLVNGEPVAVAPLHHGDVFHCGKVPFRFALPTHSERARRAAVAVAVAPTVLDARPANAALANLGRPGAAPPTAESLQVAAVLDQVAQVQQHSFEQFRQVLGTVMQMVGVVMADQRAFVKDELDRMERMMVALARPAQPYPPAPVPPALAAAPPAAPPAAPAPPPAFTPPAPVPQASANDLHLHNWVESQLQSLQRDQDTLWTKLKRRVGGDPV